MSKRYSGGRGHAEKQRNDASLYQRRSLQDYLRLGVSPRCVLVPDKLDGLAADMALVPQ